MRGQLEPTSIGSYPLLASCYLVARECSSSITGIFKTDLSACHCQ